MRVFVAGATGVLGRRLVPELARRGHHVVGMTRSPERAERLAGERVEGAVADALDADAVIDAVERAQPEVVVHQLTALSDLSMARNIDRAFAATNRLRTEGTDNLLAAARAADAGRFVAQSFAGWPYARQGGSVKDEDDPLDSHPPAHLRRTLGAIRHLESVTLEAGGTVLRYGGFYGPGTSLGPGGEQVELLKKRRFPIVGGGGGVWSLVHVDDAALATVAAIERGATGVFNVADDHPAPIAEWVPELAKVVGADPPRRVPRWLARIVAGDAALTMLTESRGASNAKAKRELGWEPRYASWRQGFREGLGDDASRDAGVQGPA
jgi:nucleoside-diphosphate-sugar epimerase